MNHTSGLLCLTALFGFSFLRPPTEGQRVIEMGVRRLEGQTGREGGMHQCEVFAHLDSLCPAIIKRFLPTTLSSINHAFPSFCSPQPAVVLTIGRFQHAKNHEQKILCLSLTPPFPTSLPLRRTLFLPASLPPFAYRARPLSRYLMHTFSLPLDCLCSLFSR